MENCVCSFFYTQTNLDKGKGQMQALVLHICINYNTIAFCYSCHLLNMYEFECKESGTIKRQTEKGSQGKL